MDFLECGICHIRYDEDDQKPRNSPCGHEFCTTCLKALINEGEYVCPKCREKSKVNAVEDLPVVFGLIDVIRAFKANTISMTNDSDLRETGASASNEDVCRIHCHSISHWCSKCELWICSQCLDSHTSLIGCSTTSSTKAIRDFKDTQNKNVDQLLNKFEEDKNHVRSKIQEHANKRKEYLEMAEEHGEEVKRYQYMLELGDNHKNKLVESKNNLNETNSPHAVCDSIKIVIQRKQTLLSWAAKNIGTTISLDSKQGLLKALADKSYVYFEVEIKNEKRRNKFSQLDGNIYVHTFKTQHMNWKGSRMSLDLLEKMIPSDSSLLFLELSLHDVVQGKIQLRLDKSLPNTRSYMVQLVSGIHGLSLNGIVFHFNGNQIYQNVLPFSHIKFTPDSNVRNKCNYGDVFGKFNEGHLEIMNFTLSKAQVDLGSAYYVFGSIIKGLEVLQKCKDSRSLKITDCGFIIEHD